MNTLELTNQRFGKLIALNRIGARGGHSIWRCRCDCGIFIEAEAGYLHSGNIKSCGCLRREGHPKHGLCGTRLYDAWKAIIQRCYNPSHPSFENYGGRGIRACRFIRDSPANLRDAIGVPPRGRSINRIDNNQHYSCGCCPECARNRWTQNIEWATRESQNRNHRRNVLITIGGFTRCIADWAELAHLPYSTVKYRVNAKWPAERLLAPKT